MLKRSASGAHLLIWLLVNVLDVFRTRELEMDLVVTDSLAMVWPAGISQL